MKLIGDILVDSNKPVAVICFIFKGKNTEILSTMAQLHFEKNDSENILIHFLKLNV